LARYTKELPTSQPASAGAAARGAGPKRGHRQPALPVTADPVKERASHLVGKLSATNRTEAVPRAGQLTPITWPVPGHPVFPNFRMGVPRHGAGDSTASALWGDDPARNPLLACR
jgi:hypothetical protein